MSRSDGGRFDSLKTESVDDEMIIETLAPLVRFSSDGELVTQEEFSELTTPQQIVALVLGRWAAYENGSADDPVLDEQTITEYITISSGTVRVYVTEDTQFLTRREGGYTVPEDDLHRAIEFLKNSDKPLRAD